MLKRILKPFKTVWYVFAFAMRAILCVEAFTFGFMLLLMVLVLADQKYDWTFWEYIGRFAVSLFVLNFLKACFKDVVIPVWDDKKEKKEILAMVEKIKEYQDRKDKEKAKNTLGKAKLGKGPEAALKDFQIP